QQPPKTFLIFCLQFLGRLFTLAKINRACAKKNLPSALNQNQKPKADYTMKNKYNLAVLALTLTAAFAFTTGAFAYSPAASSIPDAGSSPVPSGILHGCIWCT